MKTSGSGMVQAWSKVPLTVAPSGLFVVKSKLTWVGQPSTAVVPPTSVVKSGKSPTVIGTPYAHSPDGRSQSNFHVIVVGAEYPLLVAVLEKRRIARSTLGGMSFGKFNANSPGGGGTDATTVSTLASARCPSATNTSVPRMVALA